MDQLAAWATAADAEVGSWLSDAVSQGFGFVRSVELAAATYWRAGDSAAELKQAAVSVEGVVHALEGLQRVLGASQSLRRRWERATSKVKREGGSRKAAVSALLERERDAVAKEGKGLATELLASDVEALSSAAQAVQGHLAAGSRNPKEMFHFLAGSAEPAQLDIATNALISGLLDAVAVLNRGAAWSRKSAAAGSHRDPTALG